MQSIPSEALFNKIHLSEDLINNLKEKSNKDITEDKATHPVFRHEFSSLRRLSNFKFLGGREDEKIEFLKTFVDIMCFYGQGCSFEDFRRSIKPIPMALDNKLKFISTEMDLEYTKPVLDLISLLNKKNSTTSSVLNQKVNNIISEKILNVISHNIEHGFHYLRSEEYPIFLKDMIKDSDYGFGINVPQYDEFWESETGKEILAINKSQWDRFKGNDGLIEISKNKNI